MADGGLLAFPCHGKLPYMALLPLNIGSMWKVLLTPEPSIKVTHKVTVERMEMTKLRGRGQEVRGSAAEIHIQSTRDVRMRTSS